MTKKKSPSSPVKKRILIVDDHPLLREGVAGLINREPDLQVCGEAPNAADAMLAVCALRPDLALVDISLGERSGLELIKDLKIQHEALPVLVLSMHDESLYAERALRAGAQGKTGMKNSAGRSSFAIITRKQNSVCSVAYLTSPYAP